MTNTITSGLVNSFKITYVFEDVKIAIHFYIFNFSVVSS